MLRNSDSSTSSPDPLADSLINAPTAPSNSTRALLTTPTKPLRSSNGNLRLQDFYLTTPPAGLLRKSSAPKSIARTDNLLSPWRIHVTVEAEKDEGKGYTRSPSQSPSRRVTGRTITTTIPLKSAGDSSPVLGRRGRGRPRKSLDTPAKRSGTPIPKKSARRRTDRDVAGNVPKSPGAKATPPKKARGRPRKSLESEMNNGDIFTDIASESQVLSGSTPAVQLQSEGPLPRRKSKGRRKAMSPVKTSLYSDISINNDEATGDLDALSAIAMHKIQVSEPPASLSAEVEVEKGGEDHDPTEEHQEFDSIMESEGFSMVSVSSLPSAQQHLASHSGLHKPYSGVSHISIDISNTHLDDNSTEVPDPHESSFESGGLNTAAFAEHSSRLYEIIQQRTPSRMFSSPSLPSPPQPVATIRSPRALEKPTEGTPKLTRVVRAGVALQGALSPASNSANAPSATNLYHTSSVSQNSRTERLDDLFSGFGAGTKRELRAGLRLGEELAKRQPTAAQAAAAVSSAPEFVFQDKMASSRSRSPSPQDKINYVLSVPETTRQVEYPALPNPQLPSPEGSEKVDDDDSMSWKADTPAKQELGPNLNTNHDSPSMVNPDVDRTRLAREAEWQREREAVSKQIREANTCDVIVIESSTIDNDRDTMAERYDDDDNNEEEEEAEEEEEEEEEQEEEDLVEGDDEETIDIWQSEAQQSSHLQQNATAEGLDAVFAEGIVKPRRSKLPSPWRRDSQVVYSDETTPLEKHVAWQQDLKHAVSPQESARRKRVRFESSDYSVISEFVSQPDDESSKVIKDELSSEDEMDQETPSRPEQVSKRLTHSQYYDKVVEDLDDTWTLDLNDVQMQNSRFRSTTQSNCCEENKVDVKELSPRLQSPPRSWFSRITSFVPGLRSLIPAVTSTTGENARTIQIPVSVMFQKTEPRPTTKDVLSLYKPWTVTHYRALQPFYLAAKKDKSLYPYNPTSPAAWLQGRDIFSLGWKTVIQEWELGVVDAFLDMLRVYGVDDGKLDKDGNQRDVIDEREVMNRVFSLWVGQVQRQETPLGNATMGIFDPRHEWRRGAILKVTANRR